MCYFYVSIGKKFFYFITGIFYVDESVVIGSEFGLGDGYKKIVIVVMCYLYCC